MNKIISGLRAWWDADLHEEEAFRVLRALRERLEQQYRQQHAERLTA